MIFGLLTRSPVLLASAFCVLVACSSSDSELPPVGQERGACFPNRTCYDGLVCRLGVCFQARDAGAFSETDAATHSVVGQADAADLSDTGIVIDANDMGDDAGHEDAAQDAGGQVSDGGAQVEVEIGTLGFDRIYRPVAEGEVMELVFDYYEGSGRYDSFFIFLAMRARNFDPFQVTVLFTLISESTGEILAQSSGGPFDLGPPNGPWYESNSAPRISDCCVALDSPLIMRVEVTDRWGASGSDELLVRGGNACLNNLAEDVCS